MANQSKTSDQRNSAQTKSQGVRDLDMGQQSDMRRDQRSHDQQSTSQDRSSSINSTANQRSK